MSLLTPLALALAVAAGPIILMYVLKLRRQPQVVSSTFLWRRALEDVQANAPWQRLRPNLLLLLQLLALAALVLALARPAYSRTEAFSGDVVLIVDQSYGMQAHDVTPSRFAVALRRAHTLVAELGSGNVMSVIGMGAQPHLEIAESSDQSAINHAIDRLQNSAGGTGSVGPNFLGALSLAASLARAGQSTHVVVLTSRDSGISSLPIQVSFPVDIIRIGRQLRDLGITAFSVKRGPTNTEAVLRVSNFGQRTASSDLDLWVDGQLADVRPLTIAAGQQQNLFWTDLPVSAHQLQARLTHPDDVTSDKSAWAVLPTPITRRVLLVSDGNYFLQTALTLDSTVQLATVRPAAYQPALAQRFDAVIFDGTLPPPVATEQVYPLGAPLPPTLLVNPPAGRLGPLRFGAVIPASTLEETPAAGSGPLASLLQYVDLSDVHVAQSRATTLPGWLTPLVTTSDQPLIAAGDDGGQRLALIDFDLDRSDWPLRISFPIALQNMLRYLAPGLTLDANTLNAGQPVRFFPSPGTRDLAVTPPRGATVHLRGLGPTGGAPFPPFTDTTQAGLYRVTESGGATRATVSFAVNFFPARPAPAPGPADLHLGHAQGRTSLRASVPVSFAWAFGLLGLAVLSLEWWVAFRSR